MAYGRFNWVEQFLNDIKAQKYFNIYTSPDGKEKKKLLCQGALRLLPFGFYDVSFPKEYRDMVLATLEFKGETIERYRVPELILKQIRKALELKTAPKDFDTKEGFPWIKGIDFNHKDVAIIPIGIREDKMITVKDGELKGWTYEAL